MASSKLFCEVELISVMRAIDMMCVLSGWPYHMMARGEGAALFRGAALVIPRRESDEF
jgi:hypothetical protein